MKAQYLELFNKIDFNRIIDHPNILIAAAFWEEDRYLAAKMCYKYMRAIDDLIDCHKSVHTAIADEEKKQFTDSVHSWIEMIRNPEQSGIANHELLETIRTFHIPAWPLEAFARSMIYDINNNNFPALKDFIEYSQGASVAPASIFVHLNGLTKAGSEFRRPAFDVKSAAMPCAMFSYIVHIIRDFQKDQLSNLNYFADELIEENGLTTPQLREIAEGAPIPSGFRNMIKSYYDLAGVYKDNTFSIIEQISPLLEPRYRLSLLIIFNLYLMVYERINVNKGGFTASELNPTPEEIKERVYETMCAFRD